MSDAFQQLPHIEAVGKKKKKGWLWIIGILLILAAVALFVFTPILSKLSGSSDGQATKPEDAGAPSAAASTTAKAFPYGFTAGQPMVCGSDVNWKDCAKVPYKELMALLTSEKVPGPMVLCPKGFFIGIKKDKPDFVDMCKCTCGEAPP